MRERERKAKKNATVPSITTITWNVLRNFKTFNKPLLRLVRKWCFREDCVNSTPVYQPINQLNLKRIWYSMKKGEKTFLVTYSTSYLCFFSDSH